MYAYVASAKRSNFALYQSTFGTCSARLRDPTTSILSCGRSIFSELELKTQSNLSPFVSYPLEDDSNPPSLGLANTSHDTWIFSCFATPYTLTWPGLQNGLTVKMEEIIDVFFEFKILLF